MKLEICTDNIQPARDAERSGADRIELCSGLQEGGLTPSSGMIAAVRSLLKIDVNVLIRPRAGDFLYDESELDIMRKDIEICKREGINGVVFGILKSNGSIDIERTADLIKLSRPMSVTFHRAFDMCSDPIIGLENVISTGADRLLTSGQKNSVEEGSALIRRLVELAGNRIIIMPGGGISERNINLIIEATGASEYHMTGRKTTQSKMEFRREGIYMGNSGSLSEFIIKTVDPDLIKKVSEILRNQKEWI